MSYLRHAFPGAEEAAGKGQKSGRFAKNIPQGLKAHIDFAAFAARLVHAGGRYLPPPITQALAARTPDSSLSARERQVLTLVSKGKSNKEIAAELGIAEATVKCHVSVILMRLKASDRTQAVMTALQRGLIHV